MNKYDWNDMNNPSDGFGWLKEQIRYPEQLFEIQLNYEYFYHVDDPDTWKSESQFYQRPDQGDLFYIKFDLGEGPEFVGIDLVERRGVDSVTLAGMYVLRHGDNFGEVIFYEAPSVGAFKLLGPETARSSFRAAATEDLALISNLDLGNTLLYPLAGSLYYVIPVYSTSNDNKYQDLRKLGLVNAFNIQNIVWGEDAEDAYQVLNYTQVQTIEEGNITITYEIKDSPTLSGKIMRLQTLYDTDNLTAPAQNVIVNISIRSDIVNITKFGAAVPTSEFTWGDAKTGYNFTVLDTSFYPGEGSIISLNMTADIGSVYSITVEYKIVLSIDGEVIEIPESEWDKLTILG